jgi:hypothetical protein
MVSESGFVFVEALIYLNESCMFKEERKKIFYDK